MQTCARFPLTFITVLIKTSCLVGLVTLVCVLETVCLSLVDTLFETTYSRAAGFDGDSRDDITMMHLVLGSGQFNQCHAASLDCDIFSFAWLHTGIRPHSW